MLLNISDAVGLLALWSPASGRFLMFDLTAWNGSPLPANLRSKVSRNHRTKAYFGIGSLTGLAADRVAAIADVSLAG